MDVTRRALIGSGLAAAGAFTLPGLGGPAQARPRQGGSIRVAMQSSSTADTLDPAKGAMADRKSVV